MQRKTVLAYATSACAITLLAVGLGRVGSELDSYRLRSSDLQFEIDDLEYQLVRLDKERNQLQDRVNDQNEVISQLTHELYRANARARYAEEQERLVKISLQQQQKVVATE